MILWLFHSLTITFSVPQCVGQGRFHHSLTLSHENWSALSPLASACPQLTALINTEDAQVQAGGPGCLSACSLGTGHSLIKEREHLMLRTHLQTPQVLTGLSGDR